MYKVEGAEEARRATLDALNEAYIALIELLAKILEFLNKQQKSRDSRDKEKSIEMLSAPNGDVLEIPLSYRDFQSVLNAAKNGELQLDEHQMKILSALAEKAEKVFGKGDGEKLFKIKLSIEKLNSVGISRKKVGRLVSSVLDQGDVAKAVERVKDKETDLDELNILAKNGHTEVRQAIAERLRQCSEEELCSMASKGNREIAQIMLEAHQKTPFSLKVLEEGIKGKQGQMFIDVVGVQVASRPDISPEVVSKLATIRRPDIQAAVVKGIAQRSEEDQRRLASNSKTSRRVRKLIAKVRGDSTVSLSFVAAAAKPVSRAFNAVIGKTKNVIGKITGRDRER